MKKSFGFHAAVLSLIIAGCSTEEKQQIEPSVEVSFAPFETPTSAPRPEMDEPIERFIARWNAWVDSVPEDQRVDDAVERANERLKEKLHQIPDTPEGYDAWWALDLARPSFLWEEAGAVYESIGPELDLMRELVQRDSIGIRLDPHAVEDPLYPMVMYSSSVRGAVMGLGGRVRYLALAGRTQETADDLIAIFKAEKLIMESPGLIGWLVVIAAREYASDTLNQVLAIDPDAYTDEQLAVFQDRLIGWVDEDMASIIRAEEYFTLLQLRNLYSESIDGKLSEETIGKILEEYTSFVSILRLLDHPIIADMGLSYDISAIEFASLDQQVSMLKEWNTATLEDMNEYPPTARTSHLGCFADDFHINSDAVSFIPVLNFTSTNAMLASFHTLNVIEARSAVIVIAIHRHRLATGEWPESLEDISFDHIRVDPIDLHTDELFNYAIIDGKPLLWSGGPDRDNDGGFAVKSVIKTSSTEPYEEYSVDPVRAWFTLDEWDALSEEEQEKYDGDWILFPPLNSDMWGNEEG